MNEEKVTKKIIRWLINDNWEIIAFDFPQSGTGISLHPNKRKGKNKGTIIPDVIAVKKNICVFFENKDRYCYSDFMKQNNFITKDDYSISINNLLKEYNINNIYYGIGLRINKSKDVLIRTRELVDFIIIVNEFEPEIEIYFDKYNIFKNGYLF